MKRNYFGKQILAIKFKSKNKHAHTHNQTHTKANNSDQEKSKMKIAKLLVMKWAKRRKEIFKCGSECEQKFPD